MRRAIRRPGEDCGHYDDGRAASCRDPQGSGRTLAALKPATEDKGVIVAYPKIIMQTYRVTWTIDVQAEDAFDAAQQALRIQRDRQSTATIFDVTTIPEEVDLAPDKDQDACDQCKRPIEGDGISCPDGAY